MRNLLFLILLVSLGISCKKDAEKLPCPEPTGGHMTVGDSTFSLHPMVIIINMGKNTNGFFNDSTTGLLYLVNFLDSRLLLHPDTTVSPPQGVRSAIITLPCYTSNPDSLPSGTYTYTNIQPYPVNSFSWGIVEYLYQDATFSNFYFDYPEIDKGTLKLKHICKNTYNISLSATLTDGSRFEGSVSASIAMKNGR